MTPALFLDRDGVINVDTDYLYRIEDFEFIDGIFELCTAYQARGFLIVVVTNQSGIARGRYSEADFDRLTAWMVEEFSKRGVKIAGIYSCPHHPEVTGACSCRKPEPGMLLQAAEELGIDLTRSVMVGDKERDIVAAHRAGVRETYLFDAKAQTTEASRIIKSLRELP
ncbi:MAG: D-glycero-beta-D-manno-heptose 1,7-bisphosphate 7-phosphatase [Campylobacterales bacterium]|nr:D-glycero-beta-D-manno-heptose 1,7-bisphosphate 7-phosphatase [Campylobacterales bacterium]